MFMKKEQSIIFTHSITAKVCTKNEAEFILRLFKDDVIHLKKQVLFFKIAWLKLCGN